MPSSFHNLPKNWQVKTLGEILSNDKYAIKRGPFGSSLKKEFFVDSGVRVFEQYNPINQDSNWKRYFITQQKFKELESFKAGAGDLLISCSGTLGKILELPKNVEVGIINQALLKIRLDNKQILNSYFVHLFNSPYMQNIILENTIGSAIQNIASVKVLKQIKIPLPPLKTQKAIVEKLENAFAHIDEAVHHLKAVQTNIPHLKSSLLHSAFSGKLTESQNSSHKVQTLKSVVGVEGEFERKEGETLPFEPPHPLIKTEIPQGWEIKTLGEVCKINPKNKLDDDLEVSFIPMNLIADKYQNKFSYEIRKWSEVKKGYTHLQNRCIAIAKITPCFENGKCVILQDLKNGYGAGTTELIVVLADENKILPKFVFYFFNTTNFTKEGVKNFKGTAGQLRISKDFITNLQIPLPPLATQNQIVQILESKFTHLDNLAQFVNASLENL
ncbi:restriction endonuclease subunit S [Helicobacter typhlonius]|uniref:restriction endonuclease subunit S n=3 Tax=Helicobacter typhlonius TaxID=76936 RepID=UPI002FE32249